MPRRQSFSCLLACVALTALMVCPGAPVAAAFEATAAHAKTAQAAAPRTTPSAQRLSTSGGKSGVVSTAEASRGYSLGQCLRLAESNFPKIRQAQARARYYRAQLSEARWAPFSQWKMTAGVAVAPSSRGTAVYSPDTDVALKDNMGLGWQVSMEGVVPLFTFGKISSLQDAAEEQAKLGEHEVVKERHNVRMDVRKAYNGLLLARNVRALLREASSYLDGAIAKLEKSVDNGDADELDLFKLQTYRAELDARAAESERYEGLALAGLAFLTGIEQGFDIASDTLEPSSHTLGPVEDYLRAARLHRPELAMADAGVKARQAQVNLARAKMYPDIGVGLSGGWSRAPEITDQINPYAKDSANYLTLGIGLVMRWNLDLPAGAARLEQAQAQQEETRELQRFAEGGVGMEVKSAYAEAASAKSRHQAYERAEKTAKKWLLAVQQGIELGTEEEKALIDPAKEYAMQRYNHLNAIMEWNVAMAKLAQATGWDSIASGDSGASGP